AAEPEAPAPPAHGGGNTGGGGGPGVGTYRRRGAGCAGAARVDAYEDQLDAEERREQGTPRPELIVDRRDYDRDAAAEVTEPLCVSCRLERACIDRWTGQITTGHGDDGLCGTCRDEGRQGIPKLPLGHSRSQAIQARLDTIATNFDSHTPALFRHEWRYGNALTKDITAAWVTQHNPDAYVTPTVTTESVDLNGECIECGDWRQLRDELCVDCHEGLNGDVVIAGTLESLTVKGSFTRVINDDTVAEGQTLRPDGTATASNDRYRAEFVHRLNVGRRNQDDSVAASPQEHSKAAVLSGAPRHGSSASRSEGVDQAVSNANASLLNPEQSAQNPAVAIPSVPTKGVTEPGMDSGVRRRQQLRNRATLGRRGRRI
ncbi:hypothetical protein, partial [Nocardia brasiliensis]|uniref:hypothetical protein n=1 Tax=Nocardia brasiliensis TaxID=37326 RepID=UPI002453B7A1